MNTELTITIQNKQPVELLDLTTSFVGLADEFRDHIQKNFPEVAAAEVRLYVKEIRAGSIVAELVAISPQLIQGVSYLNAVVSFTKHLKAAYDFLSGKSDGKPELEKGSYNNLTKILEPVAKDSASQLNIGSVEGNVYLTVNSVEANAAQESATRLLDDLSAKSAALHEKVLLYWYQARADAHSKSGDKGIIESIASHPVKVICKDDSTKAQMVLNEENPFKEAFIVDVVVETIGGKPALYKVLAVHEKLDRGEI